MIRNIFDRVARALDEEEPERDEHDEHEGDDEPPDEDDQGLLHAALVGAGVGLLVSFLLRSTSSAPTNGTTPPRTPRAPRPEPQTAAAAILGVELDADAKTVRDAFRRRVRQIHPDGSGRRLSETERLKVADEMARLVAARDLLLGRRRG